MKEHLSPNHFSRNISDAENKWPAWIILFYYLAHFSSWNGKLRCDKHARYQLATNVHQQITDVSETFSRIAVTNKTLNLAYLQTNQSTM